MANYKTPGVYIEEISTLPASIAPVATAIPAFIGYTEDYTRNRETVINKPVRITSLLEFTEIFGGPFKEEFLVTLSGATTKLEDTTIAISKTSVPYTLYYNVRMYFENGGGPCYIVSISKYATKASEASIDKAILLGGLDAVSKEDEVTLLVIPEAIELEEADRKDVYDAMLTQCNLLQDRFSIFDVIADSDNTVKEDGDHFRDSNIGTDYLKYGAAYYPPLKTTINFYYKDDEVSITDSRTGSIYPSGSKLFDVSNDGVASGSITIADNDKIKGDIFTINDKTLTEGVDFNKGANVNDTAQALLVAINSLADTAYTASRSGNKITITSNNRGYAGTLISLSCTKSSSSASVVLSGATLLGGIDAVVGVEATGTITITDFNVIDLDTFNINGHIFTEGTDFTKQADNDLTAQNLLVAITTFADAAYTATRLANVITIKASTTGVAGNSIVLSYTDSGSGNAAAVSNPTLTGGIDAVASATAVGSITISDFASIDGTTFTINGNKLVAGVDFTISNSNAKATTNLQKAIELLADTDYVSSKSSNVITITATTPGVAGNSITLGFDEGGGSISGSALEIKLKANKTLYNFITKEIKKNYVELYPSATIAGIYARVDKDRGVWKAPANVSVNMVKDPSIAITKEEQENLNVDSTSGKSINAIRKFAGKGVIVWGARTLAGNDNEWRYVPVRRLFIFIEESVKKATEFVVFEPNDANTWLRTKVMIENFLITLWKDGALTGAKPEHAFYVKIGLGQTMTSLDILEGRMNIEIGLAAVRPAEFIVLKFSHMLQKS